MGALVRWVALVATLACFTSARAAPATEPNPVQWDPAIRHGVLPNGLRYAVMHNATPSGGVSIRLGVKVGALDEHDDELGAAHFLEHMAFGASHAQLQADVEKTFSEAGVAFGRDRNAHTAADATTYEIDLPHGDQAALDLGFRWLRRVADGAHLTPEEVDRERGVILAERETRLSAMSQASDRVSAFQMPGGRLAKAPLIGDEASIKALTAAQLQAFYDRWYQPANAAVVVVGDEPVDALEARVKATFGDWHAAAPPPPPSHPAGFDFSRGLDAMALDAPNLPSVVAACRMSPAAAGDEMARLRRKIASEVWRTIASARLEAVAHAPDSSFIAAQVAVGDYSGLATVACVSLVPADGAWAKALATLDALTGDLARSPPSEDELETAIRSVRATLRGAVLSAATRPSSKIADATLNALLKGETQPSPIEGMGIFDVAVEDMTPQDAQAAFQRDWSGGGPLISLLAPTPTDAAQARQAWLSGDHADAPRAPAASHAVWAYGDFGKPGRVMHREVVPGGDYVRITFANGVVMNFKHMEPERNSVAMRLTFGDGRAGLSPADLFTAELGAAVLPMGGLGRNSYADLGALFSEENIKVAINVEPHAFIMSSSAGVGALADHLQVMAAYASDPGFRNLDALLPTLRNAALRTVRGYPAVVASDALYDAVAPGNPMSLKSAESAPVTGADVIRVMKPILTQSPLELTIVGDVDEPTAIRQVASTFGALAPRRAAATDHADGWFLRFPKDPPPLVLATHQGPPEKALVAMVWPLWVAEPARRQDEHAVLLASKVMSDALLRRIRGELGKAYSPSADTEMPDHADQGYLLAQTEVSAADLDLVRAQMADVTARIAKGDFTDQDIDNARKPYLASLAKSLSTVSFWADVIAGSAVGDSDANEIAGYQGALAAITPAQVRKAAADWLTAPPIVVVVTGRADLAAKEGPKP